MKFEQLLENLRIQESQIQELHTVEYANQILHTWQLKDGSILDVVEFPKSHFTLEAETRH